MSENLMPHIRLPKDLDVDCALLPGDPARADTVASHLEDARLLASNREFRSWQGTYKGKKMLVTSTGIGAASCAIAVEELIQCGVHNLIRIGSCGALQPECALGDLIFVTGRSGTMAPLLLMWKHSILRYLILISCVPAGKVQLLKIFLITWGSVAVTAAFMVIGTRNFTVIGPENEQLLLIWKPQRYLYSVPFEVCVLHRF